jgi:hypothetical protein
MDKLKPNFTQIPNYFLDEVAHTLSHSEMRVAMYIMRRTYGFRKESDKVSISQICKGIKDRNGVQLDNGTGLTNKSVINALRRLEEIGLITTEKRHNCTTKITMNTGSVKNTLVENLHPTSGKFTPQLVENLHTQKKGKESIQKKDAAQLQVESLITAFKDINPIYRTWFPNTTQRKACAELLALMDIDRLLILIQKVLPVTNRREYAPTITTPHQLLTKFAQLQAYLEKEKTSNLKKRIL